MGYFSLSLYLFLPTHPPPSFHRALGLMLIYLLERQRQAGNQYSALRQLRPMIRLAPRRPFPPVENPWAYVRASPADLEFSMTKSLVAVVFVGYVSLWRCLVTYPPTHPPTYIPKSSSIRSPSPPTHPPTYPNSAFYGYLLANAISLFFLPTWLLALAGGGIGGYTATLRDGRGDMVRCLGTKDPPTHPPTPYIQQLVQTACSSSIHSITHPPTHLP